MCLLSFGGCRSESQPEVTTTPEVSVVDLSHLTEGDALEIVKELRDRNEYDLAADAAYKVLIQYPDSVKAKLLSAEIEIERGNKTLASEIVDSIDVGPGSDSVDVDVHVHLLVRLERISDAADVLGAALRNGEDRSRWRHEVWRLLNRVGRRHEASVYAESLCQDGLATSHELLSLVSRARSYPTPDMSPDSEDLFESDLGKARWFFSSGDHLRAKEELLPQSRSGFAEPAADALYGRLLAELQDWEQFREWIQRVSTEAKEFNDYWAALGTYWSDNREYEAAARGLLEAVYRDPTDRLSVQRLFSVLSALGRIDDAEQFRHHRGHPIKVPRSHAPTEDARQRLHAHPRGAAPGIRCQRHCNAATFVSPQLKRLVRERADGLAVGCRGDGHCVVARHAFDVVQVDEHFALVAERQEARCRDRQGNRITHDHVVAGMTDPRSTPGDGHQSYGTIELGHVEADRALAVRPDRDDAGEQRHRA